VFFLGDLNYRIEDSLTIEEIFAAIQANEFEKLREKDQLNQERAAKRVFQGFAEGVLNFAPTYKYQPGTAVYETRPEKKLRAPAWCDRVLWKTAGTMGNNDNGANSASVRQLSYSRAELTASDHKPVSASFALKVREVVESKEKVVFQELIGFLRKYASTASPGERSEGPLADITGLKVNFQTVFYEV
jgi:phosphatidylinositol-bisphosphatase